MADTLRATDPMLVDSIGYQLRLTSSMLRRQFIQRLQAAGIDASPEQITLLTLLTRQGDWTPADMAAANGHDRAAVTRMLQAMGQAGWVRAEAHPDSGSRKRVRITPTGRRLLARVEAVVRHKEQQLRDHLGSAGQTRALMSALRRLQEGVRRHG
ncbi:MAG: MarR family winged helix-turn-helix transcriptional regulator [Xenophilus sp.]